MSLWTFPAEVPLCQKITMLFVGKEKPQPEMCLYSSLLYVQFIVNDQIRCFKMEMVKRIW